MDTEMDKTEGVELDHPMEMDLCDKHLLIKCLSRSRSVSMDPPMVKPTPMDFRIDHNSPIRFMD